MFRRGSNGPPYTRFAPSAKIYPRVNRRWTVWGSPWAGEGDPPHPPFSAAGIHRKTHEKRAFQGIKQQKKRLRSCASATISERGHVLRLPVCARSGCGGRGGGQSQTEQSSRPTGKQKSTRKARNCVFPVLYGKPFSVGTLCPFSIAHQNRKVK